MILDTNALSALMERNGDLIERIGTCPRLATPLISLGEFRYGISLSRDRDNLEHWLEQFLKRTEILNPSVATLSHYVTIRGSLKTAGTPIPANDCWIAALVKQHKMTLVSRDRHFDKVAGIRRIDW